MLILSSIVILQVRHLDTTDKSELHKLQLLKDEQGKELSSLHFVVVFFLTGKSSTGFLRHLRHLLAVKSVSFPPLAAIIETRLSVLDGMYRRAFECR